MLGRAIRFALVFMVLTGLIYPLATTGLAQLFLPHQANGSLINDNTGQVVGSELIGQLFTKPQFFHGRVSSIKYDASAAGSPNYAPTDEALLERVKADVEKWEQENPGQPVPSDLLTNSGSGIDPHISPMAAMAQVPRVARANGVHAERVKALVDVYTEGRTLGIFGEPRVNVLKLNMALLELLSE